MTDECKFCVLRQIIKKFMDDIESLEVGAELYDDAITDLFNNADDTYSLLRCYCMEGDK